MSGRRSATKWVVAGSILFAAVAWVLRPTLMSRHPDTSSAFTIGDTRTLISAEAAYESANKGYYGTLECLRRPSRCIPGYTGPAFLVEEFGSPRRGYLHEFHPGPGGNAQELAKAGASPTSIDAFAYVSLPIRRDGKRRGFCGDNTGVICQTETGGRPRVEGGQCVMEPATTPRVRRWPWSSLPVEEGCVVLR